MENKNTEILEIYKLHCEMADRTSQRRNQTNQFYITALSVFVGILSLSNTSELKPHFNQISLIGGIMGLILCIVWAINIRSYRQLNSAKFKVLHEIEKKLEFQFFIEEWKHLGGGKFNKKYYRLTVIERYIPALFCIPFIILIAVSLFF